MPLLSYLEVFLVSSKQHGENVLSSFGSTFVSNKICCTFVETLKVLLDNFEFKLNHFNYLYDIN